MCSGQGITYYIGLARDMFNEVSIFCDVCAVPSLAVEPVRGIFQKQKGAGFMVCIFFEEPAIEVVFDGHVYRQELFIEGRVF